MSDVKMQVVWLPDGFGGGEHVEVCRASDYAALEAELAQLRAGQEPVLYANGEHLALALDNPDKEGRSVSTSTVKGHYCDTPLYTAPATAQGVNQQLLEALEYALPYLMACVPNPRNGLNADGSADVNCVDRARAAIAAARKGEGK